MNDLHLAAAVVVGILSIARTLRLIVWDDFPPMKWLRLRLAVALGDTWNGLITCPFCLAPYATAVMGAWAYYSDFHWTWWVINAWWGLSYLPAIIVAYDQPDD